MSNLTTTLEALVLSWDSTAAGNGDFGARTFLYQHKEFGHLHDNGDLDIVFGEEYTKNLLQKQLVQKHRYVPSSSITYHLASEEDLPFALSLLRFSYIIHCIRQNGTNAASKAWVEGEMAKLPNSLSSIYFK